jgi:hypothetical protein
MAAYSVNEVLPDVIDRGKFFEDKRRKMTG